MGVSRWGLDMGMRILTLIVIDAFFCAGLPALLYLWSIFSCIALIIYLTWSIVQLMHKAKQPSDSSK